MKPTKPQRQPKVTISPQIDVAYNNGVLTITTPIVVNGVKMAIQTGLDVSLIPDSVWRQMAAQRSGIALATNYKAIKH